MFRILTRALLLLAPVSALAQSVRIRDIAGGSVDRAVVYTASPAANDTLGDGRPGDISLPATGYPRTIRVEAPGYQPAALTLSEAPKGTVTIRMQRERGSLDEVVVTGVTAPVRAQDALSMYRVIGREMIRQQGAVTLNEALKTQLNINVTNDAVLGSGIGMQGFGGEKVKILIDGMPVSGREAQNIDLSQINLNTTERVEIVQGPMSVLYGSDALGGVVNIITKTPEKKRELGLSAYYETVGKYNVDGHASYRFGSRHSLSLGGGRNFFQGWKYINDSLVKRQLLFLPRTQYLGNAVYAYHAPSGFTLRFATDYLDEKITNRGAPTVTYIRGSAMDDRYYTTRILNRLSIRGRLGAHGTWQSSNGFSFYRRVKQSVYKDLVTLLETPTAADEVSYFNEFESRSIYTYKQNKLELNGGVDADLQQGISPRIDGTRQLIDVAALAMASYRIVPKLTLQGGLRAAYNSRRPGPLVPSFNLLYRCTEDVQIRASYAKGFRQPSLKELYLDFVDVNHDIHGNPSLRAENGNHIEGSISYRFYKKQRDFLQLMLVQYYNEVKDGIVLVSLQPNVPNNRSYEYRNVNSLHNTITNLQFEAQWKGLHLTAGYALNHTFQLTDGNNFNYSEANLNASWLVAPLKTSVNLFYKYNGTQPSIAVDITGNANYSGTVPSYQMIDLSLQRRFWDRRLDLVAGVKNLLDIQQIQATGFVQSTAHSGNGATNFLPRSFFTSLQLTLN